MSFDDESDVASMMAQLWAYYKQNHFYLILILWPSLFLLALHFVLMISFAGYYLLFFYFTEVVV